MLVVSYFCIYVSHLLGFDLNDVVKFDIKYFFLEEREEKKKKLVQTHSWYLQHNVEKENKFKA